MARGDSEWLCAASVLCIFFPDSSCSVLEGMNRGDIEIICYLYVLIKGWSLFAHREIEIIGTIAVLLQIVVMENKKIFDLLQMMFD